MGYCSDFFSGGRGMMRGGMFGMGIFWWILIIVGIIALVYFLRDTSRQQRNNTSMYQEKSKGESKTSPLDILDEEFAKGTISEEEYLHKKEILKK